jgi:hypothetical protein
MSRDLKVLLKDLDAWPITDVCACNLRLLG